MEKKREIENLISYHLPLFLVQYCDLEREETNKIKYRRASDVVGTHYDEMTYQIRILVTSEKGK